MTRNAYRQGYAEGYAAGRRDALLSGAPDDGPRPCDVEVSPGVRCGRRAGHRGMHINHAATAVPSSRPGSAPPDAPSNREPDLDGIRRRSRIENWPPSQRGIVRPLLADVAALLAALGARPTEAAGGERERAIEEAAVHAEVRASSLRKHGEQADRGCNHDGAFGQE